MQRIWQAESLLMSMISIFPAIMAGIVFYIGVFHFLLYLRRPQHREDLTFALTCLGVACYDVCCAGLYASTTVEEGFRWQCMQPALLSAAGIAFVFFVRQYTAHPSRKVTIFLSGAYLLTAAVTTLDWGGLAWTGEPHVTEVALPFGVELTYYEVGRGPANEALGILALIVFLYIGYEGACLYRRGHRKKALPLLASLAVFFLGVFNDTAVASGLYSFVYMIEYSFSAMVLLMAYSLSEELVQAARVKEALQQSEEKYRGILDSIHEGYYEVDLAGNYTFCNPAFCRILGYSEDEVLCSSYRRHYVDEASIAKVTETYNKVYRTGTPVHLSDWEVIRKDGSKAVLEVSASLLRDAAGQPAGFRGIARDISERKRSEEALLESQARYSAVVESAYDGIVIVQDQKIAFINKAGTQMSGYSAEEMTGRPFLDFVDDKDKSIVGERYESRIAGRDPISSYGFSVLCKDGSAKDAEMSVAAIHYGDEPATVVIIRDISERKRAEEERLALERQVQHAQKLESLGVLAGGIAHDFNNILVSILGYADLALEDMSPHAPARENLKEIEKGAHRAAELAKQMLAYSGKGRFEVTAIDLSELVEEMAHLLQVSTSKKAILRYDFADNLPAIEGDATQIRQVIMNLITNASEAIGDKSGVISVLTGAMECDSAYLQNIRVKEFLPEGTYTYVEVADTGCGMDRETRYKVFDPFFTTKFTGRGLGMAAVQGIVRGHKGAIKIYSERGKGTTFKVLFPAIDREADRIARTSGGETEEEAWTATGTVLLVDDEDGVLALGRRMLERVGFDVLTAADGREALDVLREHVDDIVCVVLDLTMPHMDGEECYRELRRIKKDVRVIISSGYNEQDVVRRFIGKGLAGFIQKPYQLATLRARMRESLE